MTVFFFLYAWPFPLSLSSRSSVAQTETPIFSISYLSPDSKTLSTIFFLFSKYFFPPLWRVHIPPLIALFSISNIYTTSPLIRRPQVYITLAEPPSCNTTRLYGPDRFYPELKNGRYRPILWKPTNVRTNAQLEAFCDIWHEWSIRSEADGANINQARISELAETGGFSAAKNHEIRYHEHY